jgi:hypothetical protein
VPEQEIEQGTQAGVAVLDAGSLDLTAADVDDHDRVIVTRPVQPTGQAVGRLIGRLDTVVLADFTSASSLLVPVGRRLHAVPGCGCHFAH